MAGPNYPQGNLATVGNQYFLKVTHRFYRDNPQKYRTGNDSGCSAHPKPEEELDPKTASISVPELVFFNYEQRLIELYWLRILHQNFLDDAGRLALDLVH